MHDKNDNMLNIELQYKTSYKVEDDEMPRLRKCTR